MGRIILLCLVSLIFLELSAQVSYTAKDQVAPYTGVFRPGSNLHFTPAGENYDDIALANIAAGNPSVGDVANGGVLGAGVKTIRPALPARFVDQWGIDIRVNEFQHYENIGLRDLTCFVGYPAESQRSDLLSYDDNGVPCQSTLFKNMYEPIWDGGANGTPYNDDNVYAAYLWDVVTLYTKHVKFWEIWNEPGRDFTGSAWKDSGVPGNWFDMDPPPCGYELKAPIQHYVRLLRISYEIIKTISPDDYVTVAGVGSRGFLDAILRNTDNPTPSPGYPNGGAPTAEFPHGGGAYFDVMGFHSYPDIDGTVRGGDWDPALGDFPWQRNSDRAAYAMERRKGFYQGIMDNYGFDGNTYPKKEWIVTEFNAPRRRFNASSMADEEMQINYMLKTFVNAMKLDIRQIHIYSIYEDKTESEATHEFDLLGLYKNLNYEERYENLEMNKEGLAYKTSSDILFGTRYDAAKTASLGLPASLDGGAFINDAGQYTYVLWAKTTQDRVEFATGTYSFPASFGLSTVYKKEWDYAITGTQTSQSANGIALTQRPIYLTENETTATPVVPFISVDTNEGCTPAEFNFIDLTTPDADGWLWTFPGGTPATSTDQNPTVTYNEQGSFDVTLEVTNNGQTATATYSNYIVVEASPTAQFAFTNASSSSITFINQSSNSNYYYWSFGDGGSSQDFNPYHNYAASGTYQVNLTAANDCTVDVYSTFVTINLDSTITGGTIPPVADFEVDNQTDCAPSTMSFTDLSANTPTAWLWSFEGGTPATSTERNPVVTYATPGSYSVILESSNAGGTDTKVELAYISIDDVPEANFSLAASLGNTTFSNLSQNANSYSWDFGDGNNSIAQNPTHVYTASGTYTIVLTATNPCGTSTTTETVTIELANNGGLSPVALFSSDIQSACSPTNIQFTDLSTNDPTFWAWSFEGGTPSTSTLANPLVTYSTPGTYSVILQAGNTAGTDTEILLSYIVIDDVPTAGFTIAQTTDVEAAFSNISTAADSYTWDFGDGNTSTDTNPTHTYDVDGTYTITLVATNDCGSTSMSQDITISNSGSQLGPEAAFSSNMTTGCAPVIVQYTDESTNTPTDWSWSFEGGTPATSTDQNPSVTYMTAGTYTVILESSNAAGSDTEVEISYITIEDVPFAMFSSSTSEGIANFVNASSGANTYAWDFGDGNTSTDENPQHNYTDSGNYTVILTASNDCGSTDFSFVVNINIAMAPAASFQADLTAGCAPLTIQFTDESSNNPDNWLWSFDGGNPSVSTEQNPTVTFEQAGVYTVILQAGNAAGSNTQVETDFIVVEDIPDALFTLNQEDANISFFNSSDNADTYSWDFGDGLGSEEANPSHQFMDEGTFLITLTATNACGSDTWTEEVTIDEVIVPLAPVALFVADATLGCVPFTVQFTDQSTTNPNSWSWLFDGGSPASSDEQNPVVTYTEPGIYRVTLAVSNAFGNDINSQENYIVVNDVPVAAFDAVEDNGKVSFTNNSLYSNSFIWDFGDGNTSTDENPVHTYDGPGTYNVILQVAGPCGFNNFVMEVVVDEIVGVENLPFVNEFNIFPNPNNGEFTIQLIGESKESIEVSFLNVLGQSIQTESYDFRSGELNKRFNLNGLATGVYLVKISSGVQAEFHKLVIEE